MYSTVHACCVDGVGTREMEQSTGGWDVLLPAATFRPQHQPITPHRNTVRLPVRWRVSLAGTASAHFRANNTPPAHRPDSPLPFCPVPPLPTTICALPPILRISPRKTHTAIQISLSTQTNPEHRVSLVTKNHPFPHLVPIPPNPFWENLSASICTLPVAFARLYSLVNILIIFIIIHPSSSSSVAAAAAVAATATMLIHAGTGQPLSPATYSNHWSSFQGELHCTNNYNQIAHGLHSSWRFSRDGADPAWPTNALTWSFHAQKHHPIRWNRATTLWDLTPR